ncbi:hypothetical protein LXL04_039353 [Taraxacum kok-saghyz]
MHTLSSEKIISYNEQTLREYTNQFTKDLSVFMLKSPPSDVSADRFGGVTAAPIHRNVGNIDIGGDFGNLIPTTVLLRFMLVSSVMDCCPSSIINVFFPFVTGLEGVAGWSAVEEEVEGSSERHTTNFTTNDYNAIRSTLHGPLVEMSWLRGAIVHTTPLHRGRPFRAAEEESNNVVHTRASINRDRKEAHERLA